MLLLLIAFRSPLIPVQAAVTNLLCVGAAFGVLVATFQWGWGLHLVGLSVAVLLAAAMVLSLAPAMLTLFGGTTWWLPGWLARVLPHVDIEAEPGPPTAEPAGDGVPGAAMRAASRRRR
jgi:uncharacterized membrane protein YdfJ with MMPL/SSD domain